MKPNHKIFLIISCLLLLCFSKSHAAIYYITSTDSAGGLQINNAIAQANADSSKDTIYFNIPGAGPFNITLIYPVPVISKPILIDGLSQPGNDTTLWLISLTGNAGFKVSSSYCTIKGLRMMLTGFYYDGAISILLTTNVLDSLKFEQNLIENYQYVIDLDGSFSVSGFALVHLVISDNKFINSPYGLNLDPAWYNRYMKHIKLIRNTFINSPCYVGGSSGNRKLHYIIANNFFQNSYLSLGDHLKIVNVVRNQFFNQSRILAGTSFDSLIISDNYFDNITGNIQNPCVRLYIIGGTENRKFYFERNNLSQHNCTGLELRMSGSSNDSAAINGIFIRNNYFFNSYNYSGIQLVSIGGNKTFKNIFVNNNILDSCYIQFVSLTGDNSFGNIFIEENKIDFPGTPFSSKRSITFEGSSYNDSIVIRNDTLTGSGIYFKGECTGNEKIYISNNYINPNKDEIGIDFRKTDGSETGNIIINGNTIFSGKSGILIRHIPQFEYADTSLTHHIEISQNQIYQNDSCGIIIFNCPSFSSSIIDSITITQNNIYSNLMDGIRIWNVMDDSSLTNITSHIHISQDTITGNSGHGISFINYGASNPNLSSPDFHHLTYSLNSIYNNGLLGINIENINDPFIPLTPIFPFPVLTNLTIGAGNFNINGYLQADTNQSYTLEFFQNTLPDSSGSGEGETYIGSLNVITDAAGFVLYQFPVTGTPGSYYFTSTATNDSTGNTSIFSNNVDVTTGINELTSGTFQIFPNPTVGKFSIQCSERISQITITNLAGEIVFRKDFSVPALNTWRLDLSNQPKGIYLVHAVADKKVYNEKIIVE